MRGIATLFAALALTGCGLFDDTPTYRYRMTVEVDTPEGLKIGSSVIEIDTSSGKTAMSPAGSKWFYKVRGEAAAVDLGERGVLFALLRSENDVNWPHRVMPMLARAPGDNPSSFAEVYPRMIARKDLIELPQYLPDTVIQKDQPARPMLVTFGDLSDPTSVTQVDPDDLALSFGEGVSLKRITLQITDDNVTTGIEERLEWLEEFGREHGALKPGISRYLEDAESINLVTPMNFNTELYK